MSGWQSATPLAEGQKPPRAGEPEFFKMHDDEDFDVAEFMKSCVSARTPAVLVPQLAQGLVDAPVQDSILQRILEQITHACPVLADQVVPTISSQDSVSQHRPATRPLLLMEEKLAEVPKIGPRNCVIVPVQQMAEQLVERCGDHQGHHGFLQGQSSAAFRGEERQGLHGSRPEQNSTAYRGEEHQGLHGSLPGQSSTAAHN